ncbi:phospholipase domain-containing protein [Streptomyces sp. NBC_00996]|uniref:phospholipase domain-containing protein n=1 Tax=Streptomyces sp. NBC_00996 TaxID=2903710 RepID=UPI003863045C
MVGPNRFLRRFKGDVTKAGKSPEVSTRYATEPGSGKTAICFKMANSSAASVKFTITSHHYRSDGPWTYTVAAGGSTEDFFNAVAYQGDWYDFTITVDSDATWSRPFTRHIETVAASVSG